MAIQANFIRQSSRLRDCFTERRRNMSSDLPDRASICHDWQLVLSAPLLKGVG